MVVVSAPEPFIVSVVTVAVFSVVMTNHVSPEAVIYWTVASAATAAKQEAASCARSHR